MDYRSKLPDTRNHSAPGCVLELSSSQSASSASVSRVDSLNIRNDGDAMELANVLIAEQGADWSNWALPFTSSGRTLIVFVQQPDETKRDFSKRIARRIERLKMKAAAWFFLGRRQHGQKQAVPTVSEIPPYLH